MPSEPTSEIQRRMFYFIVKYIQDEGVPPTRREISTALRIGSIGHVDYLLSKLEKNGLITVNRKNSRGIILQKSPNSIPVIGSITAGRTLEVLNFSSEELEVSPSSNLVLESASGLVVKGQSMIDEGIHDGDYLIIKTQNTYENSDMVLAFHKISGQVSVKQFFQDKDEVRLESANPAISSIYISKSEWDKEWEVKGKVLEVSRKFNSKRDAISVDSFITKASPEGVKQVPKTQQDVPTRCLRAFLCHSSGDKRAVHQLYLRLQECNIDPWLDKEKLLPGQDWEYEIRKAVRHSDVVIACISQESISKTGFVQKEIKLALDVYDEQPEGTIFLIPLKLEDCILPDRLKKFHAVNYFEGDGFTRLVKSLNSRSQLENLAPVILPENNV